MSYGYGGRANPFDQRDAPSGGGGYGAPAGRAPPPSTFGQGPRPSGGGASRYNQGPAMGRDEYSSGNVEMDSLARNAGGFGQGGGDPNAILNECRDIDQGINQIDQNLNQLRMLQDRSLNEADSGASSTTRQLDALSAETMSMYRTLTDRVRMVKSNPESQQPKNAPQVGRVDRRLKQAIQTYQQVESTFRKKTQDQMARQYRIVRPDADESEVRAVVEDSAQGAQIFQQAMMQSNRMGQARAVLNAVQDRHAALQRIEQQMIELAQLFQDMDTLVVQQETQVAAIEQKGEEIVENLDKGNEEIAVAVTTARSTRKKKWICLGIIVAIIVVIAVAVVIYVMVNKPASSKKRSIVNDSLRMNNVEARSIVEFAGERPIANVYAQSKIVTGSYDPESVPLSRFAGGGKLGGFTTKARSEVAKRMVIPGQDYTADSVPVARFEGGGRAHSLSAKAVHLTEKAVAPNAAASNSKRFVVWPGLDDDSTEN